MTRHFFSLGMLLFALNRATAQPTPAPPVYAIVGAKIEIGDGRVIEKGTVVLRDGMIEAVGADVKAPADAEIITGAGLVVYPGFMDAYHTRGLKLPDPQPDQDIRPAISDTAPAAMREANRKGVRPELRAVEHLDLTGDALTTARKAGFTTLHLAPTGGIINGRTGLVNLSGAPKRYAVVTPEVGMDCAFRTAGRGASGGTGYPGSLMGVIAHFRQTMLDARHFRLERSAFEKRGGPRPPADDSLAALLPVLEKALPVIFEADTENQIARALKLADEFQLRVIVNGGIEAYKIADTLKQRNLPVLLSLDFGPEPGAKKPKSARPQPDDAKKPEDVKKPEQAKPEQVKSADEAVADEDEEADMPPAVQEERKSKWNERVAGARKLHEKGVPFAFTTKGLQQPNEFLPNVRRAIKAGLPRDAALQAMTRMPSRLFGLEKQMGTVEAGKIAALTVLTADFTDEKAKPRYLFVDRVKVDLEKPEPRSQPRPRTPAEEDEDGHPHDIHG